MEQTRCIVIESFRKCLVDKQLMWCVGQDLRLKDQPKIRRKIWKPGAAWRTFDSFNTSWQPYNFLSEAGYPSCLATKDD